MPIALAVLMSFVLAPLVRLLQGWRVPRSLAVVVVAVVAFSAIFSLGGLMVMEVNQLASDRLRYQSTLRENIQSLRGARAVTGTLERASHFLNTELNRPKRSPAASAPPTPPEGPSSESIQVEIAKPTSIDAALDAEIGSFRSYGRLSYPLYHHLGRRAVVAS